MEDVTVSFNLFQVLPWVVVVLVVLGAYWAVRKARNHPDYFQSKIETPLDAAARVLAAQGWTPAEIDRVLLNWANRDLTAKAAAAHDAIPLEIINAANKVSEWAKNRPLPPQ